MKHFSVILFVFFCFFFICRCLVYSRIHPEKKKKNNKTMLDFSEFKLDKLKLLFIL